MLVVSGCFVIASQWLPKKTCVFESTLPHARLEATSQGHLQHPSCFARWLLEGSNPPSRWSLEMSSLVLKVVDPAIDSAMSMSGTLHQFFRPCRTALPALEALVADGEVPAAQPTPPSSSQDLMSPAYQKKLFEETFGKGTASAEEDDVLSGLGLDDQLSGLGEDDQLSGLGEDNQLSGLGGDDQLSGLGSKSEVPKSKGSKSKGSKSKVPKSKGSKSKASKSKAAKSSGEESKVKKTKAKKNHSKRSLLSKKKKKTKKQATKAKEEPKEETKERPSLETAAMDLIPQYQDSPACNKCQRKVDPLRMRMVGKSAGVWQCLTCNTRYTQLHRHWGRWPPKEFEGLSADEKAAFWQQMGDAGSPEEQDEVVHNCLKNRVIESRMAGERGEYLPLSVYAARGFDATRIEANCKDTKEHAILGTTYRVDITFQSKHEERQRIQEEILKSIKERRGSGKASSSGVGQGKGKGKGKGKASHREPAPAPTVATKKMQSDAVKILAKVSPAVFAMRAALKNKKIRMVPECHVTKLKEHLGELVGFEAQAQKTVSQQAVLGTSLSSVADACSGASTHSAMVQGMLASFT